MKTIWKFQIRITDVQEIEMPKGAEVLTVQEMSGHVYLWAIVGEHSGETENRIFHIYGTGNPMPDIDRLSQARKYIGTVQQAEFYVWHVFEVI